MYCRYALVVALTTLTICLRWYRISSIFVFAFYSACPLLAGHLLYGRHGNPSLNITAYFRGEEASTKQQSCKRDIPIQHAKARARTANTGLRCIGSSYPALPSYDLVSAFTKLGNNYSGIYVFETGQISTVDSISAHAGGCSHGYYCCRLRGTCSPEIQLNAFGNELPPTASMADECRCEADIGYFDFGVSHRGRERGLSGRVTRSNGTNDEHTLIWATSTDNFYQPYSRTLFYNLLFLATSVTSLLLTIFVLPFSSLLTDFKSPHKRESIQSWTCKFAHGASHFMSDAQSLQIPVYVSSGMPIPAGFTRLCKESEVGQGLVAALLGLGVVSCVVAVVGLVVEKSMIKKRNERYAVKGEKAGGMS